MAAAGTPAWRLEGRTALVTGGTQGIGLACASELAGLGCHVLICARTPADVERVVGELRAKGGGAVDGVVADVSNTAGVEKAVAEARRLFGGELDILFANAGTNVRKPTVDFDESDWDRVMNLNLKGTFVLCQRCHPLLAKSKRGASVVFNSSVCGVVAVRSGTIYAATKGAINQLTKNLACEWAKDGIRVNAVAPWYTATPLANQVLQDKAFRDSVLSRTPMRRVGEPGEVATAMVFFALPAASYVTGQVLSVDGGFTVNGFYPPELEPREPRARL